MNQKALGAWAFVFAGVVFLAVGAIPVIRGEDGRPAYLILAVAFLLIGAAIARRSRSAPPPG